MYTTMKEYFKAKDIEINDLPIVTKSATGFREHIVFKGGIVAKMSRGNGVVGELCVWTPDEAKYVNKIVGSKVLNTSPANLTVQNNNNNTIIFERFGDVRIMWTVPVVHKIINRLLDDVVGIYGLGQYVGHTVIICLKDLGHVSEVEKYSTYPDLTSTNMEDQEFANVLKDRLGYLETALDVEFFSLLKHRLNSKLIGFDDAAMYFETHEKHLYRLSFTKADGVDELRERLSQTALRIIDDYKAERL